MNVENAKGTVKPCYFSLYSVSIRQVIGWRLRANLVWYNTSVFCVPVIVTMIWFPLVFCRKCLVSAHQDGRTDGRTDCLYTSVHPPVS